MAIDFNKDIAPLRQQYFPMLTGASQFDRSMAYDQEVLSPLRQRVVGLQNSLIDMRRQELLYKRQKLELKQQREQMRMQREINDAKPLIEQRLAEITDDNLSPAEQRQQMRRFAIDNADLLRDASVSNMFNIYEKTINERAAEQAKEQAKRDSLANMYLNNAVQSGTYNEQLDAGIRAGIYGATELSQEMGAIRQAKEMQAARMLKDKEAKAEEAAKEVKFGKAMSAFQSRLDKIEPIIPDREIVNDDGIISVLPDLQAPKILNKQDRQDALIAVAAARGMTGFTEEDLAEIYGEYETDEELLEDARLNVARRLLQTGLPEDEVSESEQMIDSLFQ